MKSTFGIFVLVASFSRADDLTPLDVKSGLWETTTVSERGGMPQLSAEQMAKMPAEAKARIQAMSQPTTETKQSCLTKEDISKFASMSREQSCKVTTVASTGSRQEFKFECEGSGKSTGSMKIEALDSTHVNTLVLINMTVNNRPMNMKVSSTAKWLGMSCGNVKPETGKK